MFRQTGFGKEERQTLTDEEQAEKREEKHQALSAQRDKVCVLPSVPVPVPLLLLLLVLTLLTVVVVVVGVLCCGWSRMAMVVCLFHF